MGTTFERQTTLDPDRSQPGRYWTEVSSGWNCPFVPHGGLMAAVAARAMMLELADPELPLRTLTTVFAAQVPAGPVAVDVAVLRRGRSMAQLAATLHEEGEPAGHTSVAVFGRLRPGFEFTDVAMPDVPSPEECPSFRDPIPDGAPERPDFPFWDLVEGRPALGHSPWDEEYVPTSSERASWYRFDAPPVLADGTLDPLALVTLCDTMPGAVGERMGPGGPMWFPPSADLTVHLLGPARSEWVLGHNRAHHAGDGYASVEMTVWDPVGALVAYATQMMFFTFPEGLPTAEQRRPAKSDG
ncbi:MAG: acyl-CoA thioesterase [Acidimicrobiales bacterium]